MTMQPHFINQALVKQLEETSSAQDKPVFLWYVAAHPIQMADARIGWQFLHDLLTIELPRHSPMTQEIQACAAVLVPLIQGRPVDRKATYAAAHAAHAAANAAHAAAHAARTDCYQRMRRRWVELLINYTVIER